MEKIKRREMTTAYTNPPKTVTWRDSEDVADKVDEIVDYLILLDKLAIRVARLEVYYKAHRKDHTKNERD